MISDIMDTIKALNDGFKVSADLIFKNRETSISRRSRNAICYFPVLTSKSISYEEITMINKVLERQYTTYLRVAMSLDDVIDGTKSKAEYINQFHTNFDNRVGGNLVDSISSEKRLMSMRLKEDSKPYKTTNLSLNENKILESKLSDIKSVFNKKQQVSFSPFKESATAPIGRLLTENGSTTSVLTDNDVKKANEVIPTTMEIEVRTASGNNTKILMGVKTINHPIDSEEMIFNVANCIREKRFFFRAIQWTSGEIRFFKDFVLSADRIKANVQQARNKNTNWWRSLRNKTVLGLIKQIGGRPNVIPNTTLVLSMDEIEYITNSYGINLLTDVNSVSKLLSHFCLLGFVILDSSSELAYMFFDGEANYQTFSYNALERENRNNGNDMKALVSLLGR